MAAIEAQPTPLAEPSANRRKSARQTRKPAVFGEAEHIGRIPSNGSAKRKRGSNPLENGVSDDEGDEESSVDEDEDEPDEEELKAQRRAGKAKSAQVKKSAAKKPKISNGTGHTLAIRTASNGAQKQSKVQKARARQSQVNEDGLYAEIFGRDQTGEDAAAHWLTEYEKHNINAVTDMVNTVLRCTGCKSRVDNHDIEDVDNVPGKLGDLQDEYQAANVTDYPLVSKAKQYVAFRSVVVDFFNALIKTMHATSVLYEDHALFENIQLWVDTMSSAGIRPFRHTATVISLTISTALCEVARDLQTHIARSRTQLDNEKKKKSVNKGRVSTIQESIEKAESRLEFVESLIKDEFDLVFVHRYRDVDPKIRVECVTALGSWIQTYRTMFLEGQYLRYLGWVLSDTVSQTRLEVINQLRKLFKDSHKIPALRAFTERFRPRLVEMALQDAEAGVRASTVELLELLRVAELLEPDDIDLVGKLIFDREPRVRKAVAKFFVANINDLYQVQLDEVGEGQLNEHLPKTGDDYLKPARSWIKFKCLAQTLKGYAGDDTDSSRDDRYREVLVTSTLDSRYVLATQAIFQHLPELSDWESLAGYLLFDHSQIEETDSVAALYKLEEGEEIVLLEVLDNGVKLHLLQLTEAQPERKGRKKQAEKDDLIEKQESTAHNLTQIIPQLLNTFGSVPEAASAILRLEHLLNIDLLSDLQQSATTYTGLLDDINKQFMTHSDRSVLAEASLALLNAKKYEQSKEATDTKVQEMWDDTVSTLEKLLQKQNVDTRGTLPIKVLQELSHTVSRMDSLARISDCTAILEAKSTARKQKHSALELLLDLVKRGIPDDDTTEAFVELEDALTTSVIRTTLFYFMWKVQLLKAASTTGTSAGITDDFFDDLTSHRNTFVENLFDVISDRTPTDSIRLVGISTILDLFILISTLRNVSGAKSSKIPGSLTDRVRKLIIEIPPQIQPLIAKSHDAAEKHFAKLSRRVLERRQHRDDTAVPEDPNAPPVDPDEEPPESDSEADDVEEQFSSKSARTQATLVAEQTLCELTGKIVLGILGRVSAGSQRERILRNRMKLGQNYKEVLAYLEEPRGRSKKAGPVVNGTTTAATGKPNPATGTSVAEKGKKTLSEPLVLEDDDIEDDEDEEIVEEDGEEDLRRRGLEQEEDEEREAGANEGDAEGVDEDDIDDEIMGD